MVGVNVSKKAVNMLRVLDIGCGPITKPLLTYKDGTFDLVMCINALDHTPDAQTALEELIRVSKGTVYIDCALIQHTTSGKGHYWDMKENGTMTNGTDAFSLKDYDFEIELIDNKMERRYNHVVAILEKNA